MLKFTEEQLKKSAYVNLDKAVFDISDGTYFIKKYSQPVYLVDHCYIVQLFSELVNNATSNTAINWNSGSSPQTDYLKIFVSKKMGKMIYVDSIAVDKTFYNANGVVWSGWLPVDQLIQLVEVPV